MMSKENNKPYLRLIFVTLLILVAALPFHYAPYALIVFPKDNLSFTHTFISESEVNTIIMNYNDAGLVTKLQIMADPYFKRLKDAGLIVDMKADSSSIDSEENNSSNYDNANFQGSNKEPTPPADKFNPDGYYVAMDSIIFQNHYLEHVSIFSAFGDYPESVKVRFNNQNTSEIKSIESKSYEINKDGFAINFYDPELGEFRLEGTFNFKYIPSEIEDGEIAATSDFIFERKHYSLRLSYTEGD